jgi:Tol biopolymer transport system component
LTPNGKFIVNWKPAWDSVVVQTAGGARVTAFVPSEGTDVPDHWFDMTRGYNAFRFRPFEMSLRLSNPERTLTLPDTFGNPPFAVRWAPDGKRFAAVGRNPRNLVIVNADGSVQKRFPVSHLADFFRGIKWSPDGQRLMWTVPAAGIHVVDVTTGAELQLPSGVGSQRTNPIWRSDSKAILYGMLDTVTAAAADSTVLISLRERNLDGTERVFGSVRAQNTASVRFVSDSMALVWRQNEYRAIPLRRIGDSQVVYTREGSGQPVPSFSENGLWMAVRVAVQGERLPRRIDVMRIDGSERRTVQLDMTTLAGQENPVVSNDGRELFVLGTINGGLAYQRVDVATGRSTRIAAFQTNDRDGFSPSGLSPDGRSVVYLTALPRYTRIYEVDMSTTLTTGGSARRNP